MSNSTGKCINFRPEFTHAPRPHRGANILLPKLITLQHWHEAISIIICACFWIHLCSINGYIHFPTLLKCCVYIIQACCTFIEDIAIWKGQIRSRSVSLNRQTYYSELRLTTHDPSLLADTRRHFVDRRCRPTMSAPLTQWRVVWRCP